MVARSVFSNVYILCNCPFLDAPSVFSNVYILCNCPFLVARSVFSNVYILCNCRLLIVCIIFKCKVFGNLSNSKINANFFVVCRLNIDIKITSRIVVDYVDTNIAYIYTCL